MINLENMKVFTSQNIIFLETCFPYSSTTVPTEITKLVLSILKIDILDDPSPNELSVPTTLSSPLHHLLMIFNLQPSLFHQKSNSHLYFDDQIEFDSLLYC